MSKHIYQPFTYFLKWSGTGMMYYGVRHRKNCHPGELWTTYFTSSEYVRDYIDRHGDPDIIRICKTFKDADSANAWERKLLSRIDAMNHLLFLNKTNGSRRWNGTDPEIKKKMTERSKKGLDNMSPEEIKAHKEGLSQGQLRRWKNMPESVKKSLVEKRNKYWSDKNKKRHGKKISKAYWDLPKLEKEQRHKKWSQGQKMRWSNMKDEERRAHIEATRKFLRDPKKKQAWQESIKASHAAMSEEEKIARNNKISQRAQERMTRERYSCPHCGRTITGKGAYNRWHGDNCKSKK